MQDYRVQLDSYSGPMDLLLYLIRRDEVDIYDIPITRILDQYLSYVRLIEALDPDTAGEFLVLAATLMEIKSRMLLPKAPPESSEDDAFDPRSDLVRQLLAYRSFRDAADKLQGHADVHGRRFARGRTEPPPGDEQVDLEDVQIWDLLTAFNKLLAAVGQQRATHDVLYDDTPITLHADDILDRMQREGQTMTFEQIFEGRNRSEMIGLFLALLELIRQRRVRVQQEEPALPIMVHLIDATPITTVLDEMPAEGEAAGRGGEQEELEEAPFEEVEEGEAPEAVFLEEEEAEDEEDEFSRQINAVEIRDVDLGRKGSGPSDADQDGTDEEEDRSGESHDDNREEQAP